MPDSAGAGMPALSATPRNGAMSDVLATLPSQLQEHGGSPEDMTFLRDICGDASLQSLVKVHDKLKSYIKISPAPMLANSATLTDDLTEELQGQPTNSDVRELLTLLSKPHVKAVLSAHDSVAQKDFVPVLPPLPDDLDDDEESVKIIRLVKNKEPLGATIRRHEETGAIVVARIMRGGAADRSGLINVGDELKEVNGVRVDNKEPEEVIQILAQSQSAITFKIVPAFKDESQSKDTKIYLRTFFDYNPRGDVAIPCKEAGLPFLRGEVLQVVSQDDSMWWQAKRTEQSNMRAGLIPSKHYMERRLAARQPASPPIVQKSSKSRLLSTVEEGEESYACEDLKTDPGYDGHGVYIAGLRRSFRLSRQSRKTSKLMYESKRSAEYDASEVSTYEEVLQYQHQPGDKYRVIVLVGPPGVGINELKRRLIASDPSLYSGTVPTTTRQKKSHEKDSKEYYFVSRHLFEADLHNNRFVEYGEFKGNLYGTSVDAIRSVVNAGKVCLLDVSPPAIKSIRTPEFKPFVIFVKPPSLERLRQTRGAAKSSGDKNPARNFTDEDFQEMLGTAARMEAQFGYLFDKTVVNDELAAAYRELRAAADSLERETMWVPLSWVLS
ncbi:MAGUK p55 subfamily member 7 isoform X2 [Petromyzon marinus]|uniref:MAGUK p55 subfamily member 7 isoform X2 n=1 Tax=Petromyzon marinus TaxID=7757 RepID=A0AAJ7TD80_PETMA|nr:MAGUK p55 subfamily member 7 isoform X2 [Petromyzon marinus]